ncbi:LOW QUALITY PROTEIN: DNAJ protein JJJ1 homolog [Eucalyptus grandis]|uniref:LOW QUALITY PROTEIN: DNAJ protein JJJ1 homolog n=1 Tax=Eucalyptus grandis TaxID=71139 RepID=UPI00192ED7D8|nr:LOW QUALITY PROTEIN: DNAJ protein JJJ1 homolog [Eucalyptus grandis]
MAAEKRCHYEVLGLSRDCTAEEIRSAYRKLALQRHPDKLVQSGLSPEDATAQFQELAHAYEVLSDPKERAWYDSHRSQILFSDRSSGAAANSPVPNLFSYFSNTVFSGFSDSGKGFYKVYAEVFDKIYANEISFASKMGLGLDSVREAPLMGNLESPYAQVTAFYNYWLGFCTVMDFMWVDMYDAAAGVNRKSRRVMEEENKKLRKKARREFNETVRGLAEFVKKRDKRVVDMMVKRNMENEKRREEERERKKQLERERMERAKAYEEPEWARVEEEEGEEGGSSGEEEDGERKEEKELYCVACGKKFKSEKQWENHEKSKKHKEKVAALKESFVEEDEEEEEEEENEDAEVTGVEEDGAEEIGERMRDDLEIKGEEKEQIEDGGEMSDGERFFDVDESNKEEGTKEMEGPSHKDDDDDDDKLDEMSVLEAMLSGRKNRRKMAAMQELRAFPKLIRKMVKKFMEYDNRKSTRRNRGAKRERFRKNNGEDADTGNSKDNDQSDRTNGDDGMAADGSASDFLRKDDSEAIGGNEVAKDKTLNQSSDRKRTGKKDPITKSNNAPKGRKAKASAKNADNSCETCGQEFESRTKLFKHLGETGHASLKYRR